MSPIGSPGDPYPPPLPNTWRFSGATLPSPAETLNQALEDLNLLTLGTLQEGSAQTGHPNGPSILTLNALGALLPQLGKQDVQQLLQALLHLPPRLDQALEPWMKTAPSELPLAKGSALADTEALNILEQHPEAQQELDLTSLQADLKQHLLQGQERLGKLLQGGSLANMATHAPAVGDLLTQLQGMAAQLQAPPQQSLTPLVLLYLPYLPIGVLPLPPPWPDWPEGGEGEDAGEAGGGNLPSLVVYLETVTLGKFKAVLQLENRVQLHAQITHESIANTHTAAWQEQFSAKLTHNGLPSPLLDWTVLPVTTPSGPVAPASVLQSGIAPPLPQRKLAMLPPLNLPVLMLHGAYELARLVFETDQRQDILKRRKRPLR